MPDDLIQIQPPAFGLSKLCEPILRSLPDWFGIESANLFYFKEIDRLPTLLATIGVTPVGFLTYERFREYSAEFIVLGVLPEYHRQGIGRALVQRGEDLLRSEAVEYLQLKTLSDSHPDPGYAKTRAFYIALGYRPLQEFPLFWNADSPCLQMIKRL
jgi:GNAT superfamily N-acetyltransferase